MLSDEEIIRRLKAIRYSSSSERYARRAPSINGIATQVGVSREYLHQVLNGKPIGSSARLGLSRVLSCEPIDRATSGVRPALEPVPDLPKPSRSSHYS